MSLFEKTKLMVASAGMGGIDAFQVSQSVFKT
jgi:hypothetical protein